MTEDLRERVMRDVSTVIWAEGQELRVTASRRTARRRATIRTAAAALLVVFGLVWSSGPLWPDPWPRPADRWPFSSTAPEMLRGDDVGPGYGVHSWVTYNSTEGGRDNEERVLDWPAPWLDGCPALQQQPAAGFRGHLGGHSVRADPPTGSTAASVDELLVRMADDPAAGAVLAESRLISETCASYTVGNRLRYTVTGVPGAVAGDDSFRIEMTEEGYNAATGERTGMPAQRVLLLVRVGRMVILLTSSKPVDVEWLHGVARAAVNRLCAGSGEC